VVLAAGLNQTMSIEALLNQKGAWHQQHGEASDRTLLKLVTSDPAINCCSLNAGIEARCEDRLDIEVGKVPHEQHLQDMSC